MESIYMDFMIWVFRWKLGMFAQLMFYVFGALAFLKYVMPTINISFRRKK